MVIVASKTRKQKRIKFEIHVKVAAGIKPTKATLARAVKRWLDDDEMPEGYEVSVIRWQNDDKPMKESDDPDNERAWLGRLVPWASLQIQAVRANQ